MITKQEIPYLIDGQTFIGYAAFDSSIKGKKGAVLVAHAWRGQDDFAREKVHALAQMGYIGFAIDMFGNRALPTTDEEAKKLMDPLFVDRAELRKRALAGLSTLLKIGDVDENKTGAIGFCFGGLTVLEMAKAGANLKGVVSFHGVLGDELGGHRAKLEPLAKSILAKILVLHGHDDPMNPPQVVVAFEKEMTEKKVDWQVHVYGNTTHAFTNPLAHDPKNGLQYNPVADKRSWQSMINFFNEVFK